MSNEELIDYIIEQRIESALVELMHERKTTDEENEKLLKAENIIDNLPEEENSYIRFYIDNYVNNIADEEVCLYKKGFVDGIKAFRMIIDI